MEEPTVAIEPKGKQQALDHSTLDSLISSVDDAEHVTSWSVLEPKVTWYDSLNEEAQDVAEALPEVDLTPDVESSSKTDPAYTNLVHNRKITHVVAERCFSKNASERQDILRKTKDWEIDLGSVQRPNRYRLLDFLGQGGFGTAFLAKAEQQDVVVKLSKPFDRKLMYYVDPKQPTHEEEIEAIEPRSALNEIAALRLLNTLGEDNPAPRLLDATLVPQPADSSFENGHPVITGPDHRVAAIVMEYIAGPSLDVVIEQMRHEPMQLLNILIELTKAIDKIHRLGIVHGDLKPNNIKVIVTPEKTQVKILDFGISVIKRLRQAQERIQEESISSTQPLSATTKKAQAPSYALPAGNALTKGMALRLELPSPKRDRYSLGKILEIVSFGKLITNPEELAEERQKLIHPYSSLYEISQRLTVVNPAKRATLMNTLKALDNLKITQQEIERVQQAIQAQP